MHCLRDYYTEVLQQELNEIKEPEEMYYLIAFPDETKREVNPFNLRNFLSVIKMLKNYQRKAKMGSPSKPNPSFN